MEEKEQRRYERVLVLPREEQVLFPDMLSQAEVTDEAQMRYLRRVVQNGEKILAVLRKNAQEVAGKETDVFYSYGTMAAVKQIAQLPGGQNRVFLVGTERVRILHVYREDLLYADVEVSPVEEYENNEIADEGLLRALRDIIAEFKEVHGKLPKELTKELMNIQSRKLLVRQGMFMLPMPVELRQELLESANEIEQYYNLCAIIANETQVLRIRRDVKAKVSQSLEKNQREYVLREQMKVIREELGEGGPAEDGVRFLEEVDALEATEEVKETIRREIKRYMSMNNNNGEGMVVRTYIETMLSLPWNKVSVDCTDMSVAKNILERDHYGLEKVKERILEYLAVRRRADLAQTPILCLVGPPGTGKTSIAKSIAEAMNRSYVRVCLGGVRDEAEIRGHRRTYIASMPGRIVQGLRDAKTSNPLMLLDEIDKLGSDYKGDPSAALLEVLDSAQNGRFVDHYVEQPVDLSKVIFLATANSADTIPRPLLDRMEVVELSSYTKNEKVHIAKGHLIPKQRKLHGLLAKELTFSDGAIEEMIEYYTKEAGVRGLERVIGKVCRKVVLAMEESEGTLTGAKVGVKNLESYLGRRRYRRETKRKVPEVGLVRGLAWTGVGGTTLDIEVNTLPGTGKIELTGRMGEVMQESAKAGISYIRAVAEEYGIPGDYFETHDIHIHIPEGATPKDGPSAGITMATAVLSAVTQIPVSAEMAMTGEITLRGRVLPIGGLNEKLLAAKTVGITKVLLPEANREDVDELSEEIKEGMELYPVSTMNEVLHLALVR